MSDSPDFPQTPRQAEDLYFDNLRKLNPDPQLLAAIDRYVRDRPAPTDDNQGMPMPPEDS